MIDARDPIIDRGGVLLEEDLMDRFKDTYPDADEALDPEVPEPLVQEITLTCFVNSDHAHDKVMRWSITGIICFAGRTPIFYSSKRQGAIETSTYGAEFSSIKTAVEETISIRYMLRCLGVAVEYPTPICGDNAGVILNATIPSSLLKKKHVAIAYHKTREMTAAGAVHPVKIGGEDNYADVLTKPQTNKAFAKLVGGVLHG